MYCCSTRLLSRRNINGKMLIAASTYTQRAHSRIVHKRERKKGAICWNFERQTMAIKMMGKRCKRVASTSVEKGLRKLNIYPKRAPNYGDNVHKIPCNVNSQRRWLAQSSFSITESARHHFNGIARRTAAGLRPATSSHAHRLLGPIYQTTVIKI